MPGQSFYNAIAVSNAENERLKQEKLRELYASQQAIAKEKAMRTQAKQAAEENDKQRTFDAQKAMYEGGYKDKSFANALKIAEIGAGTKKEVAELGAEVKRYGIDTKSGDTRYSVDTRSGDTRYGIDTRSGDDRYRTDASMTNQRENNVAAAERQNQSLTSAENRAKMADSTKRDIAEKQMQNSSAIANARNEVQMKLGQLASADKQSALQLRAELENAQQKLKALDLERKVLSDPLMDETKAQDIINRSKFSGAVPLSFKDGTNTLPVSAPPSSRPAVQQDEEEDTEPVMKALMEPDEPSQTFGVSQADRNPATPAPEPTVQPSKPAAPAAKPTGPLNKQQKAAADLERRKGLMEQNKAQVKAIAMQLANEQILELQKQGFTPQQAAAEVSKNLGQFNSKAVQLFNEASAQSVLSKERVDPSSGATVTGPAMPDVSNPNMTESIMGGEYVPKTWANLPRRLLKGTGEGVIEGGKRAIDLGTAMNPVSLAAQGLGYEGFGTNLSDLSKDINQEQWETGDTYTDAPLKAGVGAGIELAAGKAGSVVTEKGLKGLAPLLSKVPFVGNWLTKGASMTDDLAAKYLGPVVNKASEIGNRSITDLSGKKAAAAAANQAGAMANAVDEAALLRLQDKAGRMQSVQDMAEVVPPNPMNLPPSQNAGGDFAKAIRGEIDDVSAQMVDPLKPVAPTYAQAPAPLTPSPNYAPMEGAYGAKVLPMDPGVGPKVLPLEVPQFDKAFSQGLTSGVIDPTKGKVGVAVGNTQLKTPVLNPGRDARRAAVDEGMGMRGQQQFKPQGQPVTEPSGVVDLPEQVPNEAPVDWGDALNVMKAFGPKAEAQQAALASTKMMPPGSPATAPTGPAGTPSFMAEYGPNAPKFANALEQKAYNSGLPYKRNIAEQMQAAGVDDVFKPGSVIPGQPEGAMGVAPELTKLAKDSGIPPENLFEIINKIPAEWLPKVPMDTPDGAKAWIDAIWSMKGLEW